MGEGTIAEGVHPHLTLCMVIKSFTLNKIIWSVVAEWLGCRTLNQRVVGSNPGEVTAWYL
jgi:hypothetical protein